METIKRRVLIFVSVVCMSFGSIMVSMAHTAINVIAAENVEIKGTVAVDGGDSISETFTFELTQVKDADGTPLDSPATPLTMSRNGAGDFSFFLDLAPGTYYYKIREIPGSTPGWTYDNHTQIIKVVVDSGLVARVFYDDDGTIISDSSSDEMQGATPYEYDSNKKYTNGSTGWLEGHGSNASYFNILDKAGGVLIALCADKGHNAPAINTPLTHNGNRVRNHTTSALAMALWGTAISGVTNEEWVKLLALPDDSARANNRRGKLMQVLVWLYEAQISVTEQGGEFDMLKPGVLGDDAWVLNTPVQSLFNSKFSIGELFSQDGSSHVDTVTWQEYFHVATLIEEMMAQYRANKETKLTLTYTPTGSGTGQLTFSHDGFVPHEHGSFTADATGKYVATDGAEIYDAYLSWVTTAGLTVKINGFDYSDSGTNGISVKKTDAISVNYTGSDEITFTLVDKQLYLKSGSIKGDVLTANASSSSKSTYQDAIMGHASFVTLKSTVKVSSGSATGKVEFKNSYKSNKIDVTGTKVWVGGPTVKPDIELQLYRNGSPYGTAVTLSNGNTNYTWKDLDKTDSSGTAYTYTVKEVNTPVGYEKTETGTTVTNTYKAPSIRTNAYEGGRPTTDKSIVAATSVTITDSVTYENLIPGTSYTLTGTLMDKATGNALEVGGNVVKVVKSFTPNDTNGTESLDFVFDASTLGGRVLVVFEVLTDASGTVIARHEDINDVAQTVNITRSMLISGRPSITTNAYEGGKGAGDQAIVAGANVTITDTVTYTNLTKGMNYTITGILMDKATGQPLLINGVTVTATKDFIPGDTNGSVDLNFNFDASSLGGKTIVVFEVLTASSVTIASHEDINDAAQTIIIENKPSAPSVSPVPKTGIADYSSFYMGMMSVGVILIGKMVTKKKED